MTIHDYGDWTKVIEGSIFKYNTHWIKGWRSYDHLCANEFLHNHISQVTYYRNGFKRPTGWSGLPI